MLSYGFKATRRQAFFQAYMQEEGKPAGFRDGIFWCTWSLFRYMQYKEEDWHFLAHRVAVSKSNVNRK